MIRGEGISDGSIAISASNGKTTTTYSGTFHPRDFLFVEQTSLRTFERLRLNRPIIPVFVRYDPRLLKISVSEAWIKGRGAAIQMAEDWHSD